MASGEAVVTVRFDPEQLAELKADIERQIQEALREVRVDLFDALAEIAPWYNATGLLP